MSGKSSTFELEFSAAENGLGIVWFGAGESHPNRKTSPMQGIKVSFFITVLFLLA
jgi:hypothetical protein